MDKARPYRLMVDRRYDDPSADMVKDIRSGEIDAGVMWGPIAGYYATRGGDKLTVVPLTKDVDKAGRLDFRITMGVRQGDDSVEATAQRRHPQTPGGHRQGSARVRRADDR